jgi:hypothetical protein
MKERPLDGELSQLYHRIKHALEQVLSCVQSQDSETAHNTSHPTTAHS